MSRRLSREEKGKIISSDPNEPPRTARVKAHLPDTTELHNKFSLTLIGRITNPSVQRIWPLIAFFTELWKSDVRPVGADLGNGLFQFQFEREEDLLQVLEKRPYHFSRWMVIVQRWEPTISSSFPSLLPFWIKVQGIPIHLWKESTIRSIGEDIGIFEKMEITPLYVRMRVHINGLLPLIKSTVIEYSNGGEVTATLTYERLEKHCSKCLRLDHDINDCLVAKHEKKSLKVDLETAYSQQTSHSSGHDALKTQEREPQRNASYQFSASNNSEAHNKRPPKRTTRNTESEAIQITSERMGGSRCSETILPS